MRHILLAVLLLVTGPAAAASIPTTTYDLPLEPIGATLGVKQYKVLPLVGEASGGWRQLMMWRDRQSPYTPRNLYLRSLNLTTGTVTASLDLPGFYEVWASLRAAGDDRAYLGLNAGPGFVIYDRTLDKFLDMGNPFTGVNASGVYALDESPDGKIAIGAVGKEVSLYDPAEQTFLKYGIVDPTFAYTYVYYIEAQTDFTYAALRGASWRVVAIARATGAVTTVLETSDLVTGMNNACLGVRNASNVTRYYRLEAGVATPVPSSCNTPAPPRVAPTVQVDDTAPFQLTWYWQFPGTTEWLSRVVPVTEDPLVVSRLFAWDSDTLLGYASSYGPLFRFETATNAFVVQGMPNPDMNVYGWARLGERIYLGGYPSAALSVEDPYAPFTTPKTFPGHPGVPITSGSSNPRFITYVANTLGISTQDLIELSVGADGKLWMVAVGYRYVDAFFLISYDPATGALTRWNDDGAFYGLELSWVAPNPITNGRQIAIATRIAAPPLPFGPTEAPLFVFDTARGTLRRYVPSAGADMLGAVTWVAADHLMGIVHKSTVANGVTTTTSTLYLFDSYFGSVVFSTIYTGQLGTLPGTNGAPRKGVDFVLGPDDNVWCAYKTGMVVPNTNGQYYMQLLKIDPRTMAMTAVGRIGAGGDIPLQWMGNDLYIGGQERLRRAPALVP